MAERKKWFLYGCLGCLGIVVLVVLIGAIVSGAAMFQVRQEQVEQRVSTQEIQSTVASETEDPELLDASAVAGHVRLNLIRTEFEIEALPPGEALRVEATYDKRSYELTESLEHGADGAWTYDLQFSSSGSNLMAALRQLFGGTAPKVQVFLPSDIPLSLELVLAQGGGRLDLGGMWLTEVDLHLEQGGFQVDVDEPLRYPVERFSMRGSMGGMQVSRLGNASPRKLDVEFDMGGLELDLRGLWLNDSDINIQSSMGGAVLRLPRDVTIVGLDFGGFRAPQDAEIPPPTLRFTTSTSMGELEIIP